VTVSWLAAAVLLATMSARSREACLRDRVQKLELAVQLYESALKVREVEEACWRLHATEKGMGLAAAETTAANCKKAGDDALMVHGRAAAAAAKSTNCR
jgi:hypothetical protein